MGIDARRKTPLQWQFRRKRTTAKNRAELCFLRLFYAAERLTKTAARAYIPFLRRAAAWRDGASTKPLTVHTVTEHRAMLVAMFASPRRRCGLLRLRSGTILSGHLLDHGRSWGRRSCKVPGCLKSESEERETWTAGSLRAAFREGKPRAKTVRKRLRRSTF